MRAELPPDLGPEEERAVLAAIERSLASAGTPSDPWTLAGRAEALRLGALQLRHRSRRPWTEAALYAFARRGTESLRGRGDAR